MEIDADKLLRLGQKHKKKFLEDTFINPYSYIIDNVSYFYAIYKNKWTGTTKGLAVITPEIGDKRNTRNVFTAHTKYAVTSNIIDNGNDRANVDLTIHKKAKDFLKTVLDNENLEVDTKEVYTRAFETLDNMMERQNEFIKKWEEASSISKEVDEKCYFIDEDLEKLIQYIPTLNLIQYKQLKPRYDNRHDFDIIYQNRKKLRRSITTVEEKMLQKLTSQENEVELERLLYTLTKNISVNENDAFDDLHHKWLDYYRNDLGNRVERDLKLLRHPKW
ncbi:hypothetical protein GCM10009001_20110 [Virgibacillus siamensis]|uniref:Uncharacterized protein n=1 Tax=Virgibacillus siamensis TaxID=480071 RepID=A0ABP3RAM5_9BACI